MIKENPAPLEKLNIALAEIEACNTYCKGENGEKGAGGIVIDFINEILWDPARLDTKSFFQELSDTPSLIEDITESIATLVSHYALNLNRFPDFEGQPLTSFTGLLTASGFHSNPTDKIIQDAHNRAFQKVLDHSKQKSEANEYGNQIKAQVKQVTFRTK